MANIQVSLDDLIRVFDGLDKHILLLKNTRQMKTFQFTSRAINC